MPPSSVLFTSAYTCIFITLILIILGDFLKTCRNRYIYIHLPFSALQKMNGHLRLLNIACAAKAKWRQVVLQKASRESPLQFSLNGGSEKGFGIFVEGVEPGSKAADSGLKRGDQVSR